MQKTWARYVHFNIIIQISNHIYRMSREKLLFLLHFQHKYDIILVLFFSIKKLKLHLLLISQVSLNLLCNAQYTRRRRHMLVCKYFCIICGILDKKSIEIMFCCKIWQAFQWIEKEAVSIILKIFLLCCQVKNLLRISNPTRMPIF